MNEYRVINKDTHEFFAVFDTREEADEACEQLNALQGLDAVFVVEHAEAAA